MQIENKKGERGCNILGEVYYQGMVIKTGESGTKLVEKLPTLKIKNHSTLEQKGNLWMLIESAIPRIIIFDTFLGTIK